MAHGARKRERTVSANHAWSLSVRPDGEGDNELAAIHAFADDGCEKEREHGHNVIVSRAGDDILTVRLRVDLSALLVQ